MGGTVDATVNINQLDPRYLALGGTLQDPVLNPFFGIPEFGTLATTQTIERRQLLRPYPQFRNVLAHRVSTARARTMRSPSASNAGNTTAGARASTTCSACARTTSSARATAFVSNPAAALDNLDLEREYGYSLLDTPHRLNISGTIGLPFGAGKRWLASGGALGEALVDGLSAGLVLPEWLPVAVFQGNNNSNLLGSGQRPNIVAGINPKATGQPGGQLRSRLHLYSLAEPGRLERRSAIHIRRCPASTAGRTPFRTNWDIAVHKTHAIGAARLTIRAELINAFDNPAFAGPRIGFGAPGNVSAPSQQSMGSHARCN